MVGASAVVRELGIPRTTLYRLVNAGKIPTHPDPRPWRQRRSHVFLLSEVRAALAQLGAGGGAPTPPPG